MIVFAQTPYNVRFYVWPKNVNPVNWVVDHDILTVLCDTSLLY